MTIETPQPDPTPPSDLGRALSIAGRLFAAFALIALAIMVVGETFLDNSPIVWLTRIAAAGVVLLGATAWQRPFKPVYLKGEDDEWYLLLGWDGRISGFIRAGMSRITPLQTTAPWKRISPLMVKVDATAQNRILDTFDVHVRIMFDLYPDYVQTTKNVRWLVENYPDGITNATTGIIKDLVQEHLRQIESFSSAVEQQTEQDIRELLHRKFAMWEANGVYINETATLIDVMVTADVLRKRIDARAELSRIQIIRDVAHDMGISTDELLIQRALERLPDSRNRQSVSEIAAVLQMLRSQGPAGHLAATTPPPEPIDIEPPFKPSEPPITPDDTNPISYVEGIYEPIDPHNPDEEDEGPKGIFSPF